MIFENTPASTLILNFWKLVTTSLTLPIPITFPKDMCHLAVPGTHLSGPFWFTSSTPKATCPQVLSYLLTWPPEQHSLPCRTKFLHTRSHVTPARSSSPVQNRFVIRWQCSAQVVRWDFKSLHLHPDDDRFLAVSMILLTGSSCFCECPRRELRERDSCLGTSAEDAKWWQRRRRRFLLPGHELRVLATSPRLTVAPLVIIWAAHCRGHRTSVSVSPRSPRCFCRWDHFLRRSFVAPRRNRLFTGVFGSGLVPSVATKKKRKPQLLVPVVCECVCVFEWSGS